MILSAAIGTSIYQQLQYFVFVVLSIALALVELGLSIALALVDLGLSTELVFVG